MFYIAIFFILDSLPSIQSNSNISTANDSRSRTKGPPEATSRIRSASLDRRHTLTSDRNLGRDRSLDKPSTPDRVSSRTSHYQANTADYSRKPYVSMNEAFSKIQL